MNLWLVLSIVATVVCTRDAYCETLYTHQNFALLWDGEPKRPIKMGPPVLGTPAVIKYRFASGAPPSITGWLSPSNCKNMQPIDEQKTLQLLMREAGKALDAWSRVTNVTFAYVPRDDEADVLIGFQSEPLFAGLANIRVLQNPDQATHIIAKGLICLNPRVQWTAQPGIVGTFHAARVIAHEMGHVLGFDHPNGGVQPALMRYKYPTDLTSTSPILSQVDIDGAWYLYGKR